MTKFPTKQLKKMKLKKKTNTEPVRADLRKTIDSLSHDDLILLSDSYLKRDKDGKTVTFRNMSKSYYQYLSKKGATVYSNLENNKDSQKELERTVSLLERALKESEEKIKDKVSKEKELVSTK